MNLETKKQLIIIALTFVLGILSVLLRGWVLYVMWGWFVVPMGVMSIGLAWAIGLNALVSLMTMAPTRLKTETGKTARLELTIGESLGAPLGILLLGWVVKFFM